MQKRKHFKSIISLLLVSLILISCFPITASAKTNVADIEIDPITIIEGTFGDYTDGYFEYYPEELINFTVAFEDGEVYSSGGYYFDYNGEKYYFETETDQSVDNQWTVGNTYTMKVTLDGVSVDVPVTITDTPIERIEVEPVSLIEYTNGVWQYDFNNESGKYEKSYYCYDLSAFTAGTVCFKDGTSTEFIYENGCTFEYNGETYWVTVTEDQSIDNQWTAGNEYNVKFEAMGVTANMPVTIEESPVESIELAPISLIEYTNGNWHTGNDEEYFLYETFNYLACTVTFDNGDVVESYYDEITYKDEVYYLDIIDDQSIDNQWTAGNTYTLTVELMGVTAETEVYIDYSPVQSVELEPVVIYEYSNGFFDCEYDSETDEPLKEYFRYEPMLVMEYAVTFKDGETVTGTGSEVYYGDYCLYFDGVDPQSIDNQWTAGNTYEMEIRLTDVKSTLEVEIRKSPIVGIEIEPLELVENTSGYFNSDYYEETDEWSEEYYYYFPEEYMNYTITLDDGSTVSGSGYSFDVYDNTYYFEVTTDQSYENPWTVGNTYTYTVSLVGIEAEGEVTIIENPIESIEFEPISITEGTNGAYTWDYNGETDEWDLFYYTYAPEDMLQYTVTFKDGSEYEGAGDGIEYNGQWYEFVTDAYQSYDEQWTAGGTYTITVEVMGNIYDVDVTITESPVESIEIKPVTVFEGINGYYSEQQDLETNEWIEYFYYEPVYALEYTVTFKDGTVIDGSGDSFEYNGDEYILSVIDGQADGDIWQVGNTYTAQLAFIGKLIDIEVNVEGYTYGDVNGDGVANISDVTYIQKFLAKIEMLSYKEYMMADVNGDETVTIADATDIQKMLVGLV